MVGDGDASEMRCICEQGTAWKKQGNTDRGDAEQAFECGQRGRAQAQVLRVWFLAVASPTMAAQDVLRAHAGDANKAGR